MIHLFIIDITFILSKIHSITFRTGNPAFFHQAFQINEIRIAGKGGKRLVRGVPVASRSQREYLPQLLPRLFQKINKLISLF